MCGILRFVVARTLHLDAEFPEHIERTPNGGAAIPARVTTTGVVRYSRPDGTVVREYRSPVEVFSPESLATLHGIPVTLEHPGLVTRTNFREHNRGHLANGSVQPQPPFVQATLFVQDGELMDDIATRKRTQLSPGYNCEIDPTPGVTPEGEPFDVRQTKIRYNHIAVTVKGRQGPEVAFRLDSEGNVTEQSTGELQPRNGEVNVMRKVKIGGVEYILGGTDADNAALEMAIQREFARYDSENGKASAETIKLREQLLAATARAETAEKAAKTSARFDATDLQVMVKAAEVMGPDYDPEGKTSADIMRDVIGKACPGLDVAGKSDDYIAGVFDGLVSEDESGEEMNTDATSNPANNTPAAPPMTDQQPPRQDSAGVHPSMTRVNMGATQLPGTNPASNTPALSPGEQLRQDTINRGRAPLRPQV